MRYEFSKNKRNGGKEIFYALPSLKTNHFRVYALSRTVEIGQTCGSGRAEVPVMYW